MNHLSALGNQAKNFLQRVTADETANMAAGLLVTALATLTLADTATDFIGAGLAGAAVYFATEKCRLEGRVANLTKSGQSSETKATKLEVEVDFLKKDGSVDALRKQLADLTITLQDLHESKDVLQAQSIKISELEVSLGHSKAELLQATEEMESLKTKGTPELKAKITELQSQVEALTTAKDKAESKSRELQESTKDKVAALKKDNSSLSDELKLMLSELDVEAANAINQLGDVLKEKTVEVNRLQEQIEALTTAKDTTEAKVANLEQVALGLRSESTNALREKTAEVISLQEQIKALITAKDTTEAKVANLEQLALGLKDESTHALREKIAEVISLQEQNEDLMQQIKLLITDAAEAKVENLKQVELEQSTATSLREQIGLLTTAQEVTKEKIAGLKKDCFELSNEFSESNAMALKQLQAQATKKEILEKNVEALAEENTKLKEKNKAYHALCSEAINKNKLLGKEKSDREEKISELEALCDARLTGCVTLREKLEATLQELAALKTSAPARAPITESTKAALKAAILEMKNKK